MLHNDLSNMASFSIGFRCVDFLIKYKEYTLPDRVLNAIFSKEKRAKVNERIKSVMEYIYRNTEYTVDLIIESKDYTEELRELIDSFPFSRIVLIERESQIAQRLITGDLSYYVDDDDYRRSLVGNKNAITLDELQSIIKFRRRS